jgi:tetratricopeptide (TPR) repeat protein
VKIGASSTSDELLARGEALFLGGLHDESIPVFKRLLELEPTNEAGLFWLVVANVWAGEYTAAIEEAEAFFARFGDNPDIHTWIGGAHHFLSHIDDAVVHHRRALSLYGDATATGYATMLAGWAYEAAGKHDQAQRIYQSAVDNFQKSHAAYPDSRRVIGMLASAYALTGDKESFTQMMAKLEPEPYWVDWFVLSIMYERLGMRDEAMALFCQAAEGGGIGWEFVDFLLRVSGTESLRSDPRFDDCNEMIEQFGKRMRERYGS